MGTKSPGRRVYGVEPYDFLPGDYGRWDKENDNWHGQTPNGEPANLSGHDIVEHEDGTITVSPSIKVSTRRNGVDIELWHGHLKRGEWETV